MSGVSAAQGVIDQPLVRTANPRLVLAAVMAVSVCQFLDQTIANVALPHMRAALSASPETVTWVLTSFIIATAITAPITGWMSDKIGSRKLFVGATVLFLVASAACGAASSLPAIVVFRAIQGVAAGFIGPMTQTILFDITPSSKHAKMTSLFSSIAMMAPVSGPFVGGWLTEALSWRWCFFINLPIGIPALVVLWTQLPARPRRDRPLDVTGYVSLAVALASFQLMLDRGQSNGWFDSVETISEAAIAVGAFWVFLIHSFFAERPLFPRPLVTDLNFLSGCLIMLVVGMTISTVAAMLPTMLQTLFGWPVVFTGEVMAPRGIGTVMATAANGWLMRKFDMRVLMAVGLCIAGVSTAMMMGWSLENDWHSMVTTTFFQGLGIGLVFAPMNMIAFGGLKPDLRPDGASLLNLFRNIGGSVGISAAVALLARTQQISHAELAVHVTAASDLGLWARLGVDPDMTLRMIDGEINRQAAMIGYLDCFKAMTIALFTLLAVPFILKVPKRRPAEGTQMVLE